MSKFSLLVIFGAALLSAGNLCAERNLKANFGVSLSIEILEKRLSGVLCLTDRFPTSLKPAKNKFPSTTYAAHKKNNDDQSEG